MGDTLHLRKTPEGAWEWRDTSRDAPVWYPLAENTEGCGAYLAEVGDPHAIYHRYADTRNEPVWDGESPEKWPVL